ncbi:MAG: hypoxanthine phosphoribosyltransferase [Acetilactobacillus jinshanensis]
MNNDILKTLYSQQQIQERCQQLGHTLDHVYQGKRPLVIGVLKGAVIFMTDVIRNMHTYMQMDFIDVSSYNGGTQSSGHVKLQKDIDTSVKGRNVLFIEDIIDTGRTLHFLKRLLKGRGAKSIRICTLFDKPAGRLVDVKPNWVGFKVPNEFVVGYGMDYQGYYRNLPYVGILKPKIYKNK